MTINPHAANAAANLDLFSNDMHKNPTHFSIKKKKDGNRILKKNGVIRVLLSKASKHHSEKIKSFVEDQKNILQTNQEQFHTKEGYTDLYISAQKYNNTKSRQIQILTSKIAQAEPQTSKKIDRLRKKLTFLQSLGSVNSDRNHPDLQEAVITLGDKQKLEEDGPTTYSARKFSFRHPFKKRDIRLYPTDIDAKGKPIPHGKEAGRILSSTQKERLKSYLGSKLEFFAGIFGCKVDRFKKYHYNSHNEPKDAYWMKDDALAPFEFHEGKASPKSYWVGHATKIISIPGCNILTDVVKGHLARGLYNRQTEIAAPIEKLPMCDISILSHNHLDHYDKNAIKQLLAQQPIMIAPVGDGHRYTEMGFVNVVELEWWESQEIKIVRGGETHHVKITATPARHWAGQGPCGGHDSSFLGYVIESDKLDGSVYFAGDTARLSADHIKKLRDHFPDLKLMSVPGGPDGGIGPGQREDLESTHQASVDGLWMHMELFMRSTLEKNPDISLDEFKKQMETKKTVFMHTMTYKLGNLHLSDTKDSVLKVLDALDDHGEIDPMMKLFFVGQEEELAKAREKENSGGWFAKRRARKKINQLELSINHQKGPFFDQLIGRQLALQRYEAKAEAIMQDLDGDIKRCKEDITKTHGKKQIKELSAKKSELERLSKQLKARRGPLFEMYLDRYFAMKSYEWQVYRELGVFCDTTQFGDGEKLTRSEMSSMLRKNVFVPKIGSRLDFEKSKEEQPHKIYDEFMGKNNTV